MRKRFQVERIWANRMRRGQRGVLRRTKNGGLPEKGIVIILDLEGKSSGGGQGGEESTAPEGSSKKGETSG